MDWCEGYPEACGPVLFGGGNVEWDWDDPATAEVMGSAFRAADGEGVPTNMIEGPVVSSGATAVRGVGLDVNFGRDCWRVGAGRAYFLVSLGSSMSFLVRRSVSEVVVSGRVLDVITESAVGCSSCDLTFQGGFLLVQKHVSKYILKVAWRPCHEFHDAV